MSTETRVIEYRVPAARLRSFLNSFTLRLTGEETGGGQRLEMDWKDHNRPAMSWRDQFFVVNSVTADATLGEIALVGHFQPASLSDRSRGDRHGTLMIKVGEIVDDEQRFTAEFVPHSH